MNVLTKHHDHTGSTAGCGPLLPSREASRPLRQEVFEHVRAHGLAARADITHALDISAGSATTLTADLIASGLLREVQSAPRETGRGRPRVDLEVVAEAAYVIGIKLSLSRHSAVLADFAGNVIASSTLPSHEARRNLADLLSETEMLIETLIETSPVSRADVKAIGIGLPGIIDHSTGRVAWSSLLAERDERMAAVFSDHFAIPVALDNDANMVTLAELWFGEGRAMADFAVVTIESGVGMGLVLGNEIYRGAHGMGMELGHTKVQLDGALCRCGQRGCLEAYVADYALTREAATALDRGFDRTAPDEDVLVALMEQARSGNASAETIFRRASRYLSLGLSNVVQLFDPALIILSGQRVQLDHFFTEDVVEAMQKLTLTEGRKPCRVAVNAWGDLVWARGASALALSVMTDALIAGGDARAA
ncbi:MAG: ROK family protein [Pseudomonadota bacterium]